MDLENLPADATVQPVAPGIPEPAPDHGAPVVAAGTGVTAMLASDIRSAWASLDPTARRLVTAAGAAIVVTLLGLPLSVWDSAPFALLILVAAAVVATTAWFGAAPAARSMPIPLPTVELGAGLVAAILAVLKVVEIIADLDNLERSGGIVGLALAIVLAVAAVVMLLGATQRGADVRGAVQRGDTGAKLAALGLGLLLLGWAFNLTVSFWTMGQAALPLAVLTIAAVTVFEAPRIQAPIPVAWVGAGIAAFGALLVLSNWGDLTSLGRTELELDPGDFLGLIACSAGTALIIAGGVLSGRTQWAPAQASTDGPIAPG